MRGQIRAPSPGLQRQGAQREEVLQPGGKMRRRRRQSESKAAQVCGRREDKPALLSLAD